MISFTLLSSYSLNLLPMYTLNPPLIMKSTAIITCNQETLSKLKMLNAMNMYRYNLPVPKLRNKKYCGALVFSISTRMIMMPRKTKYPVMMKFLRVRESETEMICITDTITNNEEAA